MTIGEGSGREPPTPLAQHSQNTYTDISYDEKVTIHVDDTSLHFMFGKDKVSVLYIRSIHYPYVTIQRIIAW